MRIEFNEGGMRRVYEEAAAKIAAQDEAFRATHTGYPVEVIMSDFAELGPSLELPEETLRAYAEAVSSGEPFKWVLT
jgi:hypothetical protein